MVKKICFIFSVVSGFAFGQAEPVSAVKTGEWKNPDCWNLKQIPTGFRKVWVEKDVIVHVRNSQTVYQFSLGDAGRTGGLIIDGGTLKTTSREWVSTGYDNSALLKLLNGGELITSGRMSIGLKDEVNESLAEVVVQDGRIAVDGLLELGKTFDGVNDAGKQISSVAILRIMKGSVKAEDLIISEYGNCRVNISGGELVLSGDRRSQIQKYISDERIFAYSKAPGSRVLVEYENGKTVVRGAESPESLGLLLAGM